MWFSRVTSWLKESLLSLNSVADTGRQAENLAARFLQKQGCRLLARNYRNRLGEIDLIVRNGPFVVFVEVRSRTSNRHGHPVETVNRDKQKRIIRTATLYVRSHKLWDQPTRFDVVTVIWEEPGTSPQIEYFPDAFQAD